MLFSCTCPISAGAHLSIILIGVGAKGILLRALRVRVVVVDAAPPDEGMIPAHRNSHSDLEAGSTCQNLFEH